MLFGIWTLVGPAKHVFDVVPVGATWRTWLCRGDAAFLSSYFDHVLKICRRESQRWHCNESSSKVPPHLRHVASLSALRISWYLVDLQCWAICFLSHFLLVLLMLLLSSHYIWQFSHPSSYVWNDGVMMRVYIGWSYIAVICGHNTISMWRTVWS